MKRLIELGALVEKAGLADLAGEDRALLYGALVDIAAQLGAADSGELVARLRQRGSRWFADEAMPTAAAVGTGDNKGGPATVDCNDRAGP